MAESIKEIAEAKSFTSLQEKVEKLQEEFTTNTCEANMGKLMELIEISAKVQGQLFNCLKVTSVEGGQYGGIDTLKSRLLPWLGNNFLTTAGSVTEDTSLTLMKESLDKDKAIEEMKLKHEEDVSKLEVELNATTGELKETQDKLNTSQAELDLVKSDKKMEDEIIILRADLRIARDEAARYKRQLTLIGDYEREIDRLRTEVDILTTEKVIEQDSLDTILRIRSRSPSPILRRSVSRALNRSLAERSLRRSLSPVRLSRTLNRSLSPTRAELTNSIRHSRLVARFNDLYAVDRLDMQDRLRRYIPCEDTIKRVIFASVVDSFHHAKMAYRSFRLRARKFLSPIHTGPEALEDAVTDYIVRNLDLYDVEKSVDDVIRSMNVNPRISFPPECNFALLSPFIREVCRVAYEMQAVDPTLDVALANDSELMSEKKYRRSYDSEFTAPLVCYHIWPALMEDHQVLIKGEACTRRGLRSRSRSVSPRRRRC